jgi:putative ABC transport system substrate-binding protein
MHFDRLKRREFISLLGGAAAASPLSARAQQHANSHRIAIIPASGSAADMSEAHPGFAALFKELCRLGYVQGQKSARGAIFWRGRQERYTTLAREVVGTKPHLMFALSSSVVLSFKATTNTIPIRGAWPSGIQCLPT